MAYRFQQVLRKFGQTVKLYSYVDGDYGKPVEIKAFVSPARVDDVLLEAGYVISDYIIIYTDVQLKPRDKIEVQEAAYEVQHVQAFFWKNETAYYKATCRRLLA